MGNQQCESCRGGEGLILLYFQMRKQITFNDDSKAIEWLLDLSRCFYIKSAKIKGVIIKNRWGEFDRWRLIVEYE